VTRRSWLLFGAMCVIWGIPYLLIRVAVRDFSPGALVFGRTAVGGLILLPFALTRGGFRPVLSRWRAVVAFSVLEVAVAWVLLSDAERHLSSSLTGLLIAAVPMVAVLVARLAGVDHGGGRWRWIGLVVGAGGLVVLLGLDVGGLDPLALLEMAGVVVCYATAPVIMARRLSDLPTIPVVTAALLLTAFLYLPVAVVQWPSSVSVRPLLSVITLGVICTALAFVVFFLLIAEIGPARAAVITYVNPVVAITLGVLLLGEDVTVGMAVGFPLILVGSVLAARGGQRAETTSEVSGAAPAVVAVDD
jgi:drug/metabolite transporter (DMT)-like permease